MATVRTSSVRHGLHADMARMCARWFQQAGFHVSDVLLPSQSQRLDGTAASGLMAAAIELRSLLSSSPEGREALADFGFEPLLEKFEGDPMATLTIHCDTAGLQADLALLAEVAQRSLQVRQRILDLGDLSAHIRCVHIQPVAAPVAWGTLSVQQRTTLAPLATEWLRLPPAVQHKWIEIANRLPSMPAAPVAAFGAAQLGVRFELANGLAELVAATRAGVLND